ncbi:glycine-rich domain-containing protein [Saccharopolyspora hattusasensis]|uniref:glycine-rich domain-containing protein n=1 Tax=Saccharopolyspora hattusasensis TaxID=1128679 RepID=UPI003D9A0215
MATAVLHSTQQQVRDPRSFVAPEVWDREIALLVRDNPFDVVMAERLFGQAIAYLVTAMEKWGQGLEIGCGQLVDTAVHAFILDTVNYRQFCYRYFDGKFLEHVPEIERKCDGSVQRTAGIIQANGFAVDWPLWEADFTKCTPCHPGSNCH